MESRKNDYGKCLRCQAPLEPVWFIEEERRFTTGYPVNTGRYRKACSHLECPQCFKKEIVDDSYDKEWQGKSKFK